MKAITKLKRFESSRMKDLTIFAADPFIGVGDVLAFALGTLERGCILLDQYTVYKSSKQACDSVRLVY